MYSEAERKFSGSIIVANVLPHQFFQVSSFEFNAAREQAKLSFLKFEGCATLGKSNLQTHMKLQMKNSDCLGGKNQCPTFELIPGVRPAARAQYDIGFN
jgi:hypothetical protein